MAFMKINPTDSLYFGGGKPFNAGSESWTDSSLLPNPSVIWGALFSVLFREGKVGSKDKEKLKIKNIYLYNEKQTTVLVPAPLDIFVDSDGKRYIGEYKDVDFISNYPLKVICSVDTNREVKPLENAFIEINSLYQHYVNRYAKNLILYNFDRVFIGDYKIGIKINPKTRTTEKSHLYRIDLTQFKEEWSFLIEYECDIEFKKSGVLKLGGEGKTASYKKVDKPTSLKSAERFKKQIDEELKSKNYFKVLFKTPTYFENGWKPNKDNLLCANVGKNISIGGWDMEKKSKNENPIKEMKKHIPFGSVYVFKKDGDMELKSEDSESYKGFGIYEVLTI